MHVRKSEGKRRRQSCAGRLGLNATEAEYETVAEEVCQDYTAALKSAAIENETNPAKCKWNC
jgi:hypothetical protein